jgi:hypothetical protein
MGVSRIDLHIDRVVIHGLEAADQKALLEGLGHELSRIFSDPNVRASIARSRRTPVLRLGRTAWEPGPAGTRKLGAGIARAIGKGTGS